MRTKIAVEVTGEKMSSTLPTHLAFTITGEGSPEEVNELIGKVINLDEEWELEYNR